MDGVKGEMRRQVPVDVARNLRKRETFAEHLLWERLRNSQLGVKVRRQVRITNTPFVVDFYCHTSKLIIEVDGSVHHSQPDADKDRQLEIEAQGYRFLRFTNAEVIEHIDEVLASIQAFLNTSEK